MDDPDAPSGTFDHWIKWNMPPTTLYIEEGKEPEGVAGMGTAGNMTYTGPCPPSGTHHYRFKLYVLNTVLDLDEGSSKAQVESVMAGHIIQQTELVGLYSRGKS
jgi:Raf kinase inhibitor-like YbhB/YbcL family protein